MNLFTAKRRAALTPMRVATPFFGVMAARYADFPDSAPKVSVVVEGCTHPRRTTLQSRRRRLLVFVVQSLALDALGCAPSYLGARPPSPFVSDAYLAHAPPEALPSVPRASLSARVGSDPSAATVELDLSTVIRTVVLSDPRIKAAFEGVEQARADVTTAALFPNPTLAVNVALVPLPGASFNAETKQGGPPQLDIGLSYALDTILFGKRDAATTEAKIGVDVALADHADVARQRIIDAIVSFFDVLEARELARLAREDLEQLQRLQTITERRVGFGSVGQVELDRIEIAVVSGRRRVLSVDAELDNARTRLRSHLRGAAGAHRADAAGTLDLSAPPAPIETESVLQLAEEHRPDLVSLRRQIDRADAAVATAKRNAWPTVTVSAGVTRQFQRTANGFPDASSMGGGLEVSLPFFDRNQGNIAHARSAARQAQALLDAGRIDLHAEVEQALRSYRVAFERVTTFDVQSLQLAQAARARIEAAYALGGRTLLEVLEARAAYRDVFREHVSARAELLRSLHRVNAVVGSQVLR